jgi:hypothetical protein
MTSMIVEDTWYKRSFIFLTIGWEIGWPDFCFLCHQNQEWQIMFLKKYEVKNIRITELTSYDQLGCGRHQI